MPRAQENRALNEFLGLILLGLGTLLFLALISYEPRQVPAWFPLGRYSGGASYGSTNFIGPLGAIIACCFYFLIGAASYLAAATLLGYGGALLLSVTQPPTKRLVWIGTFIVTGACLLALQPWFLRDWPRLTHAVAMTGNSSSWIGGWAGYRLVDKDHGLLRNTMGFIGSSILLVCLYVCSLIMMTGIHPILLLREALAMPAKFLEKYYAYRLARASERGRLDIEQKRMERQARKLEKELTKKGYPSPKIETEAAEEDEEVIIRPAPKVIDTSIATPKKVDPKAKKEKIVPLEVNFDNYVLPSIELLDLEDLNGRPAANPEELLEIQATLIDTLAQFGISVAAGDITKGPTITRYEVYPAKGVRVDKIVSLERDIARATRAERINILAPIPGKDTVGIEIANTRKVKVTLRELMESEDFAQSKAKIPLALGKDVYGKTIIGDLAAMPHCLVAGTTGSGKSVCINSIIASMLYKFTPEEIRFIMIDPKVVEMQVYNSLPHLVIPVVTNPKKVLLALRWVIDEMEKRYKIFAKTGVRNITSFNGRPKAKSQAELDAEKKEKLKKEAKAAPPVEVIDFNELSDDDLMTDEPEPDLEPIRVQRDDEIIVPDNMPYIVVIVDELADLMQTAPADVESAIARITQMARAAGIHMIVATQTPRADVVTGVIKANIPTRIAFQVASGLDSRIILDEKGAERLLGQGDMLYLPPGTSRMTRAQGVLVTDEEIIRLVDFVSKQSAPVFEPSIHDKMQSSGTPLDDVTEEDEELVQKCLEIMRQEKKASTSLFQRRLRLGYTRAARVVDILEQRGYVAPGEGAKPREILKDLDTLPF
ncbi:MAG: DNA translocase FtsK 4TM domain-containing protein [Chthoniobacteraceae bacterium]